MRWWTAVLCIPNEVSLRSTASDVQERQEIWKISHRRGNWCANYHFTIISRADSLLFYHWWVMIYWLWHRFSSVVCFKNGLSLEFILDYATFQDLFLFNTFDFMYSAIATMQKTTVWIRGPAGHFHSGLGCMSMRMRVLVKTLWGKSLTVGQAADWQLLCLSCLCKTALVSVLRETAERQ